MKILITGGFGLLGARLAEHLLFQRHQITLASRSEKQINKNLSGAKFFKVNWRDVSCLHEMVQDQDIIIHAAGVNATNSVKDPIEAKLINAEATSQLARIAKNSGVSKFILLSSIHVYSNKLSGIINEDSATSNPHPYATSNLLGEKAILELNSSIGLEGIVFRLSNNFGYPAFQNNNCWSLVINDFCLQAITKNEIVINGTGEDLRDFIPISIFCDIFDNVLSDPRIFSNDQKIYNICSSNSISILDVAKEIQSLCKKEFGFRPLIKKNQSSLKNSISKFKIESCMENLLKFDFDMRFKDELLTLLEFCKLNKEHLN